MQPVAFQNQATCPRDLSTVGDKQRRVVSMSGNLMLLVPMLGLESGHR